MKVKLILCFCIVSLFVAADVGMARLGESAAESVKRYGPLVIEGFVQMIPLHEDALEMRYHYRGWRIRAAYVEDSTIIIFYSKLAPGNSSEGILADDEIEAILRAESQGNAWQKVARGTKLTTSKKYQTIFDSATRLWKNPNGSVAWTSSNFGISLISSEGLAFDLDQLKLKEEKRKKNIPEF